MPTILKDVEVDEISLVDRPANDKAVVALFKRKEEPAPATRRVAKRDRQALTGAQRFTKHLFSLIR